MQFLLMLPKGRDPTPEELAAHRRWLVEDLSHANSRYRRAIDTLQRAENRLAEFDARHADPRDE